MKVNQYVRSFSVALCTVKPVDLFTSPYDSKIAAIYNQCNNPGRKQAYDKHEPLLRQCKPEVRTSFDGLVTGIFLLRPRNS